MAGNGFPIGSNAALKLLLLAVVMSSVKDTAAPAGSDGAAAVTSTAGTASASGTGTGTGSSDAVPWKCRFREFTREGIELGIIGFSSNSVMRFENE